MSTKKFIAGILSAALMFTSSIGFSTSPYAVKTFAASSTAGSTKTISIPSSQISYTTYTGKNSGNGIKFSEYGNWHYNKNNNTYKLNKGDTKTSLSTTIKTAVLHGEVFTCTLVASHTGITGTEDRIKEQIKLNVINTPSAPYSNTDVNSELTLKVTKDYENSDTQKVIYNIECPFVSYYGNTEISLVFGDELKNNDITISNCAMHSSDADFLYSTVTDNIGQKLHIAIKKTSDYTAKSYNEWLITLGRYISSLSDITGIKYDDIYIRFNDPYIDQPTSCCDTILDSSNKGKGILIKFLLNDSDYHFEQIKANNLDWGVMHEISHAYSSQMNVNDRCYNAFGYFPDEGLVNVRGLIAIQNCKELRTKNLSLDHNSIGNYTYAFKNAANMYKGYVLTDQLYFYNKYVNSFSNGWAVLEKAMLANDVEMSKEALDGAIQFIKEAKGYTYGGNGDNSIRFSSLSSIKFINLLYFLCKNQKTYGPSKDAFKRFLKDYVGISTFAHIYKKMLQGGFTTGNSCDINCDGNFDINDLQAIKDFAAGKITLTVDGVSKADYNKDGYVNNQDAIDMQEMWFA